MKTGAAGRDVAGGPSWPVEPPATGVEFPPAETADDKGRVTSGGDLEPGTIVQAYRSGLFPMRQSSGELTWWSPDPRAIVTLDGLHVSSSLRRTRRRFEIRVDSSFDAVVAACAERDRGEYEWITDEIRTAYGRLHELGWAHSVEAWSLPSEDGEPALVGGLYGVAIGGLFAGESMFHRRPDASKAAFVALVELLAAGKRPAERLIDAQWLTPHLASLGAVAVPRADYLARLDRALRLGPPPAFAGSPARDG